MPRSPNIDRKRPTYVYTDKPSANLSFLFYIYFWRFLEEIILSVESVDVDDRNEDRHDNVGYHRGKLQIGFRIRVFLSDPYYNKGRVRIRFWKRVVCTIILKIPLKQPLLLIFIDHSYSIAFQWVFMCFVCWHKRFFLYP